MYARHLGGPPYSFTVHGPEEFESPMGLAEKVRSSAFVVAISSYCRSQLFLRCEAAQWPKVKSCAAAIGCRILSGDRRCKNLATIDLCVLVACAKPRVNCC